MRNFGKNWLEWTVFSFSSILVLALLAFLGWLGWTHTEAQVSNPGDQAAEGIEVEIEWKAQKQTAHFVLPQLPRAGKRSAYAIFQVVPEEELTLSALEARVVGYEES